MGAGARHGLSVAYNAGLGEEPLYTLLGARVKACHGLRLVLAPAAAPTVPSELLLVDIRARFVNAGSCREHGPVSVCELLRIENTARFVNAATVIVLDIRARFVYAGPCRHPLRQRRRRRRGTTSCCSGAWPRSPKVPIAGLGALGPPCSGLPSAVDVFESRAENKRLGRVRCRRRVGHASQRSLSR